MATATQQQSKPAQQQTAPATPQKSLVDQMLDHYVEYKPFMQEEKVKLSPRTVLDYLCTPTKTGKVCDVKQATRFVMLCKARGLNPWEGDAYLVGYDSNDGPKFSLITAHQAFLKRAEVHPEYDGMESGVLVQRALLGSDGEVRQVTVELAGDFFEEGDKLVGAWARVHFKNRTHPMYKRLKLGTFNKGFSRWKDDPAGMIVKCAEADALRSAFPNSLGGMYLEGELSPDAERPEKPEPPKAGRHRLGGNGDYTPPPLEPSEEEDHKELALQELIENISDRLESAETEQDFGAVRVLMKEHGEELGLHYGALLRRYQERYSQRSREPGADDPE